MTDRLSSNPSLAQVVGERWEAPFLINAQSGAVWTYGDTFSAAGRLRERFAAAGVVEGDRVALKMSNGIPFLIGYFACLAGGFVAVPLNAQLSAADAEFIVETTQPRLVFSEGSDPDRAPMDREAVVRGLESLDFDRLFTVHFTSGTTGRPKGVCHSAGTLLRSAAAFNEALAFGSGHRFLHLLPMAYMAGFLNTVLCPLLAGGSVVIRESYHARMPLDFWSVPRRYGVNVLWLVPSMAAALLAVDKDAEGAEYCRRSIERACVGTAPLSREVGERFQDKYGVRLLESYGLSETLFIASNSPSHPTKPGTVGRLLRGVTARVCDEAGSEVSPGGEGEIRIDSDFTGSGYFGTGPFVENGQGFSSGDLGFIDAEGFLFITGRRKDLIIRGGINVSPRAIEESLSARSDLVSAAAVVGVPHPLKGEEIVAFIQSARGADPAIIPGTLAKYCRETLAVHQCPDRIVLVEQMPVGVSGKIQKHKLRETLLGPLPAPTA